MRSLDFSDRLFKEKGSVFVNSGYIRENRYPRGSELEYTELIKESLREKGWSISASEKNAKYRLNVYASFEKNDFMTSGSYIKFILEKIDHNTMRYQILGYRKGHRFWEGEALMAVYDYTRDSVKIRSAKTEAVSGLVSLMPNQTP
ncbi:hypothetical protein N9138_01030 [bacterium]|nr:hypothetical protein [bacterium]MDB4759442.1 hypothetical protein [Akkermansiaceae bacterium]